jgi:hypothetical protein
MLWRRDPCPSRHPCETAPDDPSSSLDAFGRSTQLGTFGFSVVNRPQHRGQSESGFGIVLAYVPQPSPRSRPAPWQSTYTAPSAAFWSSLENRSSSADRELRTSAPRGSISRDGRTGTSRSERASIFASAISSPIEGRCALKALFKRWPNLALAVEPSQIQWRRQPGLRAIENLPVVDRRHESACVLRADVTAETAGAPDKATRQFGKVGRLGRERTGFLLLRSRSPGALHERLHLLLGKPAIFVAVHCLENSFVSRLKLRQ